MQLGWFARSILGRAAAHRRPPFVRSSRMAEVAARRNRIRDQDTPLLTPDPRLPSPDQRSHSMATKSTQPRVRQIASPVELPVISSRSALRNDTAWLYLRDWQ